MKVILLNKGKVAGLNEAQGTDEQVNRITADLTEKIMDGYAGRKLMTFEFSMDVDYRTESGGRETVSVPVEVNPGYYDDLDCGGGDTDAHYWYRNNDYPVYIRINLTGGQKRVSPSMISSSVSHELMHVITLVREFMENRQGKTALFDVRQEHDALGDVQYFLCDNEQSSYVQGMYSWCKMRTEKIMKEKGRKPTRKEFEAVVKCSREWKWLLYCERVIDNAEVEDIEDRIWRQNGWQRNGELHRYTGIGSSHASFRRYYYDRIEKSKTKMLKAAYKGYADAVAEYNKQ